MICVYTAVEQLAHLRVVRCCGRLKADGHHDVNIMPALLVQILPVTSHLSTPKCRAMELVRTARMLTASMSDPQVSSCQRTSTLLPTSSERKCQCFHHTTLCRPLQSYSSLPEADAILQCNELAPARRPPDACAASAELNWELEAWHWYRSRSPCETVARVC